MKITFLSAMFAVTILPSTLANIVEAEDPNCNENYITTDCRPNDNPTIDCSGQGTCVRGICECTNRPNQSEIISGKYCECDNFSCPRHNGLICSNNGVCECGSCLCNLASVGDACECPVGTNSCKEPGTDNICSGRGICHCGVCRCFDSTYDGIYCQNVK